ncbi:unnamed protein product [Linum tenue]|uniref:Uncharacterized protein n=1 Tax=Linum tenue TaxID=586396 RepID=A0AAV0JEG4_9ROSI|nr:unnamed protein product [Linum tenue]
MGGSAIGASDCPSAGMAGPCWVDDIDSRGGSDRCLLRTTPWSAGYLFMNLRCMSVIDLPNAHGFHNPRTSRTQLACYVYVVLISRLIKKSNLIFNLRNIGCLDVSCWIPDVGEFPDFLYEKGGHPSVRVSIHVQQVMGMMFVESWVINQCGLECRIMEAAICFKSCKVLEWKILASLKTEESAQRKMLWFQY